jgi:hypothetical protein
LLDDFEGFENFVPEVTENIMEMSRQLELEVELQDVAELMESRSQPFCNEEQRQEEDVPEEVSIVEPKGLTSKILSEVFHYFEAGMAL